jgi:hypothetical protein
VKREPGARGHGDAVPQPAVGELVVVVSLEPAPVVEQAGVEHGGDAVGTVHGVARGGLVVEEARRGEAGRGIPRLPVGAPLRIRRDERATRRQHQVAHPAAERVGDSARRLEQVERDAQREQPERLEICAEERARGPEHVVAIGEPRVHVGRFGEHPGGEGRMARSPPIAWSAAACTARSASQSW